MSRRLSLPQTPLSAPVLGQGPGANAAVFGSPMGPFERRQLPLRPNKSLTCLNNSIHNSARVRLSQPDLHCSLGAERFPVELCNQPRARLLPTPKSHIPKRFLKRSTQSDLATRLQKHNETIPRSTETTPSREISEFFFFSNYLVKLTLT